jgi:Carboxypeptidase regulatory-like domain
MFTKALELAAQITHPVTAAIFAAVLALIALLALTKGGGRKKPPQIAWLLAAIIFLLGLSPLLASTYLDSSGIYRVRIEVFNPGKEPVNDAEITSSAGGELKKTDAGWEFTIPREEKPANGEVTFRAALKDAYLAGNSTLKLEKDYFPQLTIQLAPLPSVDIRGVVQDENGRPIEGARVWVLGYDDIATTGPTGSFTLPTHAADRQQITLVAQKGDKTYRSTAIAGDKAAEVILRK